VDPVPDPLLLRESGSAGNRTWTSGFARGFAFLTERGHAAEQWLRHYGASRKVASSRPD
jgi:hypothetical protein